MRVTYEVGSYNPRRYGKPWIAKITAWPIGRLPTLEFGATVDVWTAEIDAEPGAVIRFGQKDMRRGTNTTADWGIVLADGTVRDCSASAGRTHWLAGCPVPVSETPADMTNVVAIGEAR
jgi:hypothetical protein